MNLEKYFGEHGGIGVLATADAEGRVDAAIYSRTRAFADHTLAFVMRQRLKHSNLQTNPRAAYLFIKRGPGYQGLRLFLKKTREETESP